MNKEKCKSEPDAVRLSFTYIINNVMKLYVFTTS